MTDNPSPPKYMPSESSKLSDVLMKIWLSVFTIALGAVFIWGREINTQINSQAKELAALQMWKENYNQTADRYLREVEQMRISNAQRDALMSMMSQKLLTSEERLSESIGETRAAARSVTSLKEEVITGMAKLSEKLVYVQNVVDDQSKKDK